MGALFEPFLYIIGLIVSLYFKAVSYTHLTLPTIGG